MKARRSFGSKQPSKAAHRTSLQMVLTMRADLSTVSAESLARSHRLPLPEVEKAIADEQARRAA